MCACAQHTGANAPDAGADCPLSTIASDGAGLVKLWSPEAVDADGRAVISLLEVRQAPWREGAGRFSADPLRRFELEVIKERVTHPTEPVFEVARMHFEDAERLRNKAATRIVYQPGVKPPPSRRTTVESRVL